MLCLEMLTVGQGVSIARESEKKKFNQSPVLHDLKSFAFKDLCRTWGTVVFMLSPESDVGHISLSSAYHRRRSAARMHREPRDHHQSSVGGTNKHVPVKLHFLKQD